MTSAQAMGHTAGRETPFDAGTPERVRVLVTQARTTLDTHTCGPCASGRHCPEYAYAEGLVAFHNAALALGSICG